MIIDNYIAEQFIDPTTAPWTPLTGITATISIWSVVNWVKTKVIDDASCTNDWEGYYSYLFTDMQPSTFYMYEIVPSATAYRVSGWIDYRMEKIDANISDMRVGWGWGGNYSQAIQTALSNAKTALEKKIEEEHNKTRQIVIDWDSETNSHIELAKDKTIGKIESIEIPEAKLEEKEAKKVLKLVTSVDKKLTSYIDSEMKEKDEINQITAEFTKQEIEDRKQEKLRMEEEQKMKEEEKRKEEEEQKKEEELMKSIEEEVRAEFDKQDEMEKEEKKKELEAEIKEMEREMKEKEKELKSL